MLGSNIRRLIVVLLLTLAVVVSGIVSASDAAAGRSASARKIVIRDDAVITPADLTMSRDDVLEFENGSAQLMRLIFVEPQDQMDKIRCYPINHTVARADESPWVVFGWGPARRLTVLVPPGKFASACALVPGRYAFVASRVRRDLSGVDHSLGSKGTITVL